MNFIFRCAASFVIMSLVFITLAAQPSSAKSAAEINQEVDQALTNLYATSPAARDLSKIAKAILVFPGIIKGGLWDFRW